MVSVCWFDFLLKTKSHSYHLQKKVLKIISGIGCWNLKALEFISSLYYYT